MKPRLHGSRASFDAAAPDDGVWIEGASGRMVARFEGITHVSERVAGGTRFSDGVIEAVLDETHSPISVRVLGDAPDHVLPLARHHALRLLREAVAKTINPVSALDLVTRDPASHRP